MFDVNTSLVVRVDRLVVKLALVCWVEEVLWHRFPSNFLTLYRFVHLYVSCVHSHVCSAFVLS